MEIDSLTADLKRLKPTQEELKIAQHWCLSQDASEPFANEMARAVIDLGGIDVS